MKVKTDIPTKNDLLLALQQKYGRSSVNEFVKACYSLALDSREFFSDVLFGDIVAQYSNLGV